MKLKIFTATAVLLAGSWAFQASINQLQSKPDGSPSGVTGSPGDGGKTCARSGCHTGNPVISKTGMITSNIPSTGYVPGATYTITAKAKSQSVNRWGFEISPQNSVTGALMGQLIVTNTTQTKLVGAGKYITHKAAGNSGAGIKTWTFNWKAPAAGSGKVKFYGTFLYANNNGSETGDTCYKSTMSKDEDTIPLVQDPNRNEITEYGFSLSSGINLTVTPNPFSSSARLQLQTSSQENYSFRLFSGSGNLVKMQENIPASVSIQFGDDLPPGLYFIHVIQGGFSKTMKIIRTK